MMMKKENSCAKLSIAKLLIMKHLMRSIKRYTKTTRNTSLRMTYTLQSSLILYCRSSVEFLDWKLDLNMIR